MKFILVFLQAYEVRQYDASQWVTTYTDNDYDTAQYDLYTWLADYMDGGNVKSMYGCWEITG